MTELLKPDKISKTLILLARFRIIIWVILIKTDPKLLYTLNPLSYNYFFNDLINVCTIM